jgi:hypothetical protein
VENPVKSKKILPILIQFNKNAPQHFTVEG